MTPLFWVAILAVAILLYVLLDGSDLGVGMLFGLTRDESERRQMLAAIAPVWDGNETWLVIAGTVLFGAFPRAYGTLMSTFYLPLVLMLGIFATKFFVGVNLAMHPALATDPIFAGGFSLVYGMFSGVFLARGMALRSLATGTPRLQSA